MPTPRLTSSEVCPHPSPRLPRPILSPRLASSRCCRRRRRCGTTSTRPPSTGRSCPSRARGTLSSSPSTSTGRLPAGSESPPSSTTHGRPLRPRARFCALVGSLLSPKGRSSRWPLPIIAAPQVRHLRLGQHLRLVHELAGPALQGDRLLQPDPGRALQDGKGDDPQLLGGRLQVGRPHRAADRRQGARPPRSTTVALESHPCPP